MRIECDIDGIPCYPVNREDLSIEINHDQESIIDNPRPHIGINNLYFTLEDINTIMQKASNSPGITEGVPFNITITERGQTEVLKMYIDMMDGFKRSNDGIEASVKALKSFEWADDKFEGFTFESMYNETAVTPFMIDGVLYTSYQIYFDKKCIYIPYVLSTVPMARDAFMAVFSIVYVATELSKIIKFITQWTMPMAGLGVTMGIAQLVEEVIFGLIQIACIIVFIDNFFTCLIQRVKYHGAMLLVDMLKVVCVKLNLTFDSNIYNKYPYTQIAYLPSRYNTSKENNPSNNNVFGISFSGFAKTGFHSPGYATSAPHDSSTDYIQKGYMEGTGADCLRLAKSLCNGKIIMPLSNDELLMVRRDYYSTSPAFTLPDVRQDWNGYNTDELKANIVIRFLDDLNDKNSIEKYIGNILQATHEQQITKDKALVLLKGLREIVIQAARGVRKTELNLIEKIHKELDFVFNKIVGNVAIAAINAVIFAVNAVILVLNAIVDLFNIVLSVINIIINIINKIIQIVGGTGTTTINTITLINNIPPLKYMQFIPLNAQTYTDRIDCLLLENDMVSTPKLLLVDTNRSEFTDSGGYSGQKRIAYLHKDNENIINAQFLWNESYFIDAFVGNNHNRFTNISPSLNKDSEKNQITLSLADFKNNASNPKINDNFGEEVITNSVLWYPYRNGIADITFRKKGWLKNPQSQDGVKRAEEININLQIKTSLPNGQ